MTIDDFADEKTIIGDRSLLAVKELEESSDQPYLRVLAGPLPGQLFRIGDGGDLGRGASVSFHLPDEQISRRHARLRTNGDVVVIQDLDSTNGTFVNGRRIAVQQLENGDTIRLGASIVLRFTLLSEIDGELQKQILESALRDGLTKAYNKRFFETRLEEEVAFSLRQEAKLALILFDLDFFKNVNDTHGHLAGDYLLSELALLVMNTIRREDIFARIGGEEFAILARGLDLEQAAEFAERLRAIVAAHNFSFEGVKIPLTTSLGVAAIPSESITSPQDFIAASDGALYSAKAKGRNRVELATSANSLKSST